MVKVNEEEHIIQWSKENEEKHIIQWSKENKEETYNTMVKGK